jgi:Tfp pilus assembly protein PilF
MASSAFPLTVNMAEAQQELQPSCQIVPPSGRDALNREARELFREGIELLNVGEPRGAIAKLESAVASSPGYSDGYVGLGIAYAMDSQVYPALDSFGKAAEADPASFFAHFKLAQFYFKLRVPKKGYEEASCALRCATTTEEKRLVAQVLKEERTREAGGVRRPTWNKPFSSKSIVLGIGLLLGACTLVVRVLAH